MRWEDWQPEVSRLALVVSVTKWDQKGPTYALEEDKAVLTTEQSHSLPLGLLQ